MPQIRSRLLPIAPPELPKILISVISKDYIVQISSDMNVLILNGSPRPKGNSAILSALLCDFLRARKATVSVFRLHDMIIKPCSDCRSCKSGQMVCSIDDDMKRICRVLEHAGAVIFITPVYWFGPTSQTKLAIDRLRPYFSNCRLRGKAGAVLTVAGEGYRDSVHLFTIFRKIFKTLGMENKGMSALKAYEEGEVKLNRSLNMVVCESGRKILGGSLEGIKEKSKKSI